MNRTKSEWLQLAARVVMGEDRSTDISLTQVPDMDARRQVLAISIEEWDAAINNYRCVDIEATHEEWISALEQTATVKKWQSAATNAVLGEALNSGDGSYRP